MSRKRGASNEALQHVAKTIIALKQTTTAKDQPTPASAPDNFVTGGSGTDISRTADVSKEIEQIEPLDRYDSDGPGVRFWKVQNSRKLTFASSR
jgi:hypothetical protein